MISSIIVVFFFLFTNVFGGNLEYEQMYHVVPSTVLEHFYVVLE